MSSLRVLDIVKIGLCEHLTHLPGDMFAKIFQQEKFLIYGILYIYIHVKNLSFTVKQKTPLFIII